MTILVTQLAGHQALAGIVSKGGRPLFEIGLSSYESADYKKAEKYWQRSAELGHVPAMYSLARLYHTGLLGKMDLKAAQKWYLNAAINGIVPAQYQLGRLLYGRGDFQGALRWLSEAAKADDANAQHDIALMYEEGNGVPKSLEEAAKWYEKAAENGSTPAQFKLVQMYMNGQGVEMNNAKAFLWAAKAAESGNPDAKYILGYMYYTGTGIVQSFELSILYLEEAAAEGQPQAQSLLEKVKEAAQRYSAR